MRNESGGIDPVTLIIALAVIVICGGGIFWAVRDTIRRAKQMQAFAEGHGLSYTRGDRDNLAERMAGLFPGMVFSLTNIGSREDAGRIIRIFDCQHRVFQRSKSDHNRTGCMIESPRFSKTGVGDEALMILERQGVDIVWVSEHDQHDLGSPAFAKLFVVQAKDRTAAENILSPGVQEAILRYYETTKPLNLTVGIDGKGAATLIGRSASDEGMQALMGLCRDIESALPER